MPAGSPTTTRSSKPSARSPSYLSVLPSPVMLIYAASALPEPDVEVLTEDEVDLSELLDAYAKLIVYNDDVNTFDWVIECLVDILGHGSEQAEQLAMLIHLKGKATVKSGPFEELQPLKGALVDRGLSAVIEHEIA